MRRLGGGGNLLVGWWEWVGVNRKCWVLGGCWAVIELAGGLVMVWLWGLTAVAT